eukprot:11260072-Ditylum_brightwellii.AAC.1
MEPLLPMSSSSSPMLGNGDGHKEIIITTDNDDGNAAINAVATTTAPATRKTFWHQLAKHLLHPLHSIVILACILAFTVPVAVFSKDISNSIYVELMMPVKMSPAWETFQLLGDKFGAGILNPYRILIDGHVVDEKKKNAYDKRVDTVEAFEVMHKLVQTLLANEQRKIENKTTTVTCTNSTIPSNPASALTIMDILFN